MNAWPIAMQAHASQPTIVVRQWQPEVHTYVHVCMHCYNFKRRLLIATTTVSRWKLQHADDQGEARCLQAHKFVRPSCVLCLMTGHQLELAARKMRHFKRQPSKGLGPYVTTFSAQQHHCCEITYFAFSLNIKLQPRYSRL